MIGWSVKKLLHFLRVPAKHGLTPVEEAIWRKHRKYSFSNRFATRTSLHLNMLSRLSALYLVPSFSMLQLLQFGILFCQLSEDKQTQTLFAITSRSAISSKRPNLLSAFLMHLRFSFSWPLWTFTSKLFTYLLAFCCCTVKYSGTLLTHSGWCTTFRVSIYTCTYGDSDLNSSFHIFAIHIDASCFPAMMCSKLWEVLY